MGKNLYHCTARRLATNDPSTVDGNDTVGDAYEWLDQKGYDFAPVELDGEPVGYVGREELEDERRDSKVQYKMNDIRLENIISADAEFEDILAGLEDQFFYFLGGKNQVTGILTRADLNASPARIHLFDRISLLETELRELILRHAPDWEDEVALHPDTLEEIDRLYENAKEANVELDKIHYAHYSTLVKIVSEYEACWAACGYEADHEAKSALSKVTNLRNDVVHANLILQTTSGDRITTGRSIRDLTRICDTLESCLRALARD